MEFGPLPQTRSLGRADSFHSTMQAPSLSEPSMERTSKGWEGCSEENTSRLSLSLQKRSCSGLVPNTITGGEIGSGAIVLQKLNPPTQVKRKIIIDCSGTGTKPQREKGRSTFGKAGLEKPSPPAFSMLLFKAVLPASSCVCSVETHPSRVIHLDLITEELMGKRGQSVRTMKRNSIHRWNCIPIFSICLPIPRSFSFYSGAHVGDVLAQRALCAHLYSQPPHPLHPLHHVALPNLLPVHQIQNASAQEYQTCAG